VYFDIEPFYKQTPSDPIDFSATLHRQVKYTKNAPPHKPLKKCIYHPPVSNERNPTSQTTRKLADPRLEKISTVESETPKNPDPPI
jgi:hypothetical protein